MSALRLPDFRSVVVRTNATRLPSGDTCGSVTRTAPIRSSIVMARTVAAPPGDWAMSTTAATIAAYLTYHLHKGRALAVPGHGMDTRIASRASPKKIAATR